MRYSLLLMVFFTTNIYAQSSKIYIRNNPSNATSASSSIQIKWFDEKTIFKKGEVNIYRRSGSGLWKKINKEPIQKGKYNIPAVSFSKDSSLIACVDLMKKVPEDSIKEFVLLALLLKSFESSEFAKYAGVMFEDTLVERGKYYQYKVVLNGKGGKEKEIGTSKEIMCGNFIPAVPPKELQVKAKKKSTEFRWKVETDRYYGVNIYRTASDSSVEIKLTPQPLMVSKKTDAQGNKNYADVFYTDKHLRENVSYTYRLTALDFFGYETDFSQGVTAFIADSTAPPAPDFLRFELNKYEVNLKWNERSDPDLLGFYIYKGRTSAGNFDRINTQLLNPGQNTFKEICSSGDYYYYVSAIDKAGNESFSNKVFVHVHDVLAPAAPEELQIRADTGRIYLKWLPNKEPDLMGYQVYRSVDNKDTVHFVLLNASPFPDPFYVDTLPKNIKNTFMYKVIALDSSYNRSAPSKIQGGKMPDVTPPEQPLIKNTYMKDKYLRIEWVANVDEDLWGYNLYRSTEEDSADFRQININLIPYHSTHFTDQKTETGKLYHYYLTAIDSSGNHSIASEIYTARNTDSSGAAAGSMITSAKGKYIRKNNYIHLQWDVSEKNFLGTVIYRKEKDSESLLPMTGMIQTKEYIDKNIVNANIYYYEIRVYSSSGSVQHSGILKVETDK